MQKQQYGSQEQQKPDAIPAIDGTLCVDSVAYFCRHSEDDEAFCMQTGKMRRRGSDFEQGIRQRRS